MPPNQTMRSTFWKTTPRIIDDRGDNYDKMSLYLHNFDSYGDMA